MKKAKPIFAQFGTEELPINGRATIIAIILKNISINSIKRYWCIIIAGKSASSPYIFRKMRKNYRSKISQILIGIIFGYLVLIIFTGIEVAGQFISNMVGFGMISLLLIYYLDGI